VYQVNLKRNFINDFVNFNYEIVQNMKKESLRVLIDYFNMKNNPVNNLINKLHFNRCNSFKAFDESQKHDLIKLMKKKDLNCNSSRGKLDY
jgi:hypothetical protein